MYAISPDITARIQQHFATGKFASASDVLREALDALERRQRGLLAIQVMVQEAEDDISAGRVGPFNLEQTISLIQSRIYPSEAVSFCDSCSFADLL